MPVRDALVRKRLIVPALVALLALTGCSETGPQQDQNNAPEQPWTQWTRPTSAPVTFHGTLTDGSTFNSTNQLGRVVVVNFWYAGCGPCRAEAATLNTVAAKHPEAQFVGVNVSDDAATAASFERTHHNSYPSIVDQEGAAAVQLAFAASRPPKAVPTTLVLDRTGRVTARIVRLANTSILNTLVTDAITDAHS